MVCQIGAREHYSIPRALQTGGVPATLLTDFWSGGKKWGLPSRLAQRFHADFPNECVRSFNRSYMRFVAGAMVRRLSGWDWILAQNKWFGRNAAKELRLRCTRASSPTVVFAYSYAAMEIFKAAKLNGCTTILGQIDPGPVETRMIKSLHEAAGAGLPDEPPSRYWDQWKSECALADRIVVNSNWSKHALITEGVEADKITVIPLAYEASSSLPATNRLYPRGFCRRRPLRVLFLGQVIRRKGASELLEAIGLMKAEAVHWTIVGPGEELLLKALRAAPNTTVVGPVTRDEAGRYYRDADIFILPTHSDGYALTQLEAASYGLPVIASRFCGEVVTHGQNGLVINAVTASEIAMAVRALLASPERLRQLSQNQLRTPMFGLRELAGQLQDLVEPVR